MAKYYVESGPQFQVVVQAANFVQAILKAFQTAASDEPLQLADVIIVNERGFVWHREEQTLYGEELVLPTRLVLGRPEREPRAIS